MEWSPPDRSACGRLGGYGDAGDPNPLGASPVLLSYRTATRTATSGAQEARYAKGAARKRGYIPRRLTFRRWGLVALDEELLRQRIHIPEGLVPSQINNFKIGETNGGKRWRASPFSTFPKWPG